MEFLKKQNSYDRALEVAELLKWYYTKPGSGASKQALGSLLTLLSILYSTKQRLAEAESVSKEAVKLFSTLTAINPNNSVAQAGLAYSYVSLAKLHMANQRFSDAEELFIKTDTGDVTGTLLSAKEFVYETDTGRVKLPETTTGGKCEIITDTGDIHIEIKR